MFEPILLLRLRKTFEIKSLQVGAESVIGEAAKQLTDNFKADYPGVPWRRAAGFRDILIRNYMGVDLDEVWRVVEQSLPNLKSAITAARGGPKE